MEGESSRAEPEGTIIPVFVVHPVPSWVLNKMLDLDATHQVYTSFRLHLVGPETFAQPLGVDERSRPPIPPRWSDASPFLGWDLVQVNEWYCRNIRPLPRPWTSNVFFVVDRYSQETSSVDVVAADPAKIPPPPRDPGSEASEAEVRRESAAAANPNYAGDEESEPENLRCDFVVARQLATLVEIGEQTLYEGRDINLIMSTDDVSLTL